MAIYSWVGPSHMWLYYWRPGRHIQGRLLVLHFITYITNENRKKIQNLITLCIKQNNHELCVDSKLPATVKNFLRSWSFKLIMRVHLFLLGFGLEISVSCIQEHQYIPHTHTLSHPPLSPSHTSLDLIHSHTAHTHIPLLLTHRLIWQLDCFQCGYLIGYCGNRVCVCQCSH